MATFDENDVPDEENPAGDSSPAAAHAEGETTDDTAESSDATGAESVASEDELTVDDILGAAQTGEAAAEGALLDDLESQLLDDLKRLQAEYANYRRRTDEQRGIEVARAKGEVAKG